MALGSFRSSQDVGARVQDYLNDKLQTTDDLNDVDTLLITVQQQHELLQAQLGEASRALAKADGRTKEHNAQIQQKAKLFNKRQAEVDERLQSFTKSETSDDAVKMFETLINKLQRLDIASNYVDLLREADELNFRAQAELESSPGLSVQSYRRLRSLVTAVKAAQPAAEGAAPNLVDHIDQQAQSLYSTLYESFASDFGKTLDQIGWPNKPPRLTEDLISKWNDQIETLLDLQEPDLKDKATLGVLHSAPGSNAVVLLPLEVVVRPLELRFRFHFFGDKPTNRVDRPEYFLSHILDLLDAHIDFMIEFLQPILNRRSRAKDLDEVLYADATSAFITALLPMVSAKSLSLLAQVREEPPLLSHFIHELMSFDTTLRESWTYTPVPRLDYEWKGLTWSMLQTHGYFHAWLAAERDFALERYRNIRDSSESNELDFDSTGPDITIPTKGAIRVNDLVETITDRYRSLSSFSQKLKFLMEVQIAIFDAYHIHLRESLRTYQVNATVAGKFVQNSGLDDGPSPDTSGLKGLQRLVKIFGSAEYLERKMSDWSDDIFFLELYDELQYRARHNTGSDGSVGRNLSTKEVAARTSATIMSADNGGFGMEGGGGGLFDETASTYRATRIKVEAAIIEALQDNIRKSLRNYTNTEAWASVAVTSLDFSQLSPSASLDTTLQVLSAQLGFLSTVLAVEALRSIAKQVCLVLQRELLDSVVMRKFFSSAGVMQLRRDFSALETVIDTSIKMPGEAQRCMRRLSDSLALLGLPIRASLQNRAHSTDDSGWNFEEDAEAEEESSTPDEFGEGQSWSLWEVEKLIFKSNESARQILHTLDLETLNVDDARTILRRRIELGS